MAAIQTVLIWVAYAVAVVILAGIASIFVFTYQKPGERSVIVSFISIVTLTSLLATVLLLPVDIALVSSTSLSSLGRRKDWATPSHVHSIVRTLKIVYYTLYSWDALLCLLVIPFTYFFYEEQQDDGEDGNRSLASKLWGAIKYAIAFLFLAIILFLVGFYVPVSNVKKGKHLDFDYFKHLLSENGKSSVDGNRVQVCSHGYRRRARLDFRHRPSRHHWHRTLCGVHWAWICLVPNLAHHVRSSPFRAGSSWQHLGRA